MTNSEIDWDAFRFSASNPHPPRRSLSSKFDWYSATIHSLDDEPILQFFHSNGFSLEDLGKGMQGYSESARIVKDGFSFGTLMIGGNQYPHISISGKEQPNEMIPLIRAAFPDSHHVTRVDSCMDFYGQGLFDEICSLALKLAEARGISISQQGDWILEKKGRTLYLGSRKSPVQVRIYEKTEEMRRNLPRREWGFIPENWVRVEIQVRPKKNQREVAASASADAVWGFSNWSKAFASEVLKIEAERVKLEDWRRDDAERSFDFMCRQYGRILTELSPRYGGKQGIAEEIFKRIELIAAFDAQERAESAVKFDEASADKDFKIAEVERIRRSLFC